MINANMREYQYYLYDENNAYGQRVLKKDENGEPVIQGTIKIAIHNTSTGIQDNIRYKDAKYIGLTLDKNITDAFVIQYGQEKLKVLYVIDGRYKQVFLNEC